MFADNNFIRFVTIQALTASTFHSTARWNSIQIFWIYSDVKSWTPEKANNTVIYFNYRLALSVTWPLRCWIAQSTSRTLSLLNRYSCYPHLIKILNHVFRVMFTQWVSLSGKWLQECLHLSILVPHHSHLIGILLELTPAWMKCERCSLLIPSSNTSVPLS